MGRKKSAKKNNNQVTSKVKEIENNRTGGQIALKGFSYQLIYSCYKVLEFIDDSNKSIRFEGIEDIDLYCSLAKGDNFIEHTQLKYSKNKETASFFDDILKNYLEVYLETDKNEERYFKLVYDLEIAQGNLSKLIENKLDIKSKEFWNAKIDKIKEKKSQWRWDIFNFDEFYSKLRFEYISQRNILAKIEQIFISKFEITTGNEALFLNALFYNVFHMTKEREKICYSDLLQMIQNIKDDIAKGEKNPAYDWIDKIDFNLDTTIEESQYYDGKKPTISDIINNLPVRRLAIENNIKTSINENTITVIKSSSGQGKTTLAWQIAKELNLDYCVYKLNWCKDAKEIKSIVEYFNSRLKLGEKILIIIDNLDSDTQAWNPLAQMLAEKIKINYKILITTREEDWYYFSGDQSKLGSINIVSLFLEYTEAGAIFKNLKERGKVHENIENWQGLYEKVSGKSLLIEYIYLLTHGEMLEERISHQLKSMSNHNNATVKKNILSIVSLADIIGVRIKISNLIKMTNRKFPQEDLNYIIKSIENEYLIKFNEDTNFVEGLHPIRSKYILNILHEYYPINNTFSELLSIIDESYVDKIYSQIPFYIDEDKDEFYEELSDKDFKKSYKYISNAIKGLFSGEVFKYYNANKTIIDDADKHGGLFLFLCEINLWNDKHIGSELKVLTKLNKQDPKNENIKYLLQLCNNIEKNNIKETDYYIYSYYLYEKFKNHSLKRNKIGFAEVANWLRRIDNKFNILAGIEINDIWTNKEEWEWEELSNIMYIYYLLERDRYVKFIEENKEDIFTYLKINTNSLEIFEKDDSIHINYLLPLSDIKNGNDESVKRINSICKLLPIYRVYCADAIQPKLDMLESIKSFDDSHKTIPYETVILSFNSDLNSLWNKSIISQFEFTSIYEWQNYWINIRLETVDFFELNIIILEKLLKKQTISKQIIKEVDVKRNNISNACITTKPFPFEERPFEEKSKLIELAASIKKGYFYSTNNYSMQYLNIVNETSSKHEKNLALNNLKEANKDLCKMQACFEEVFNNSYKYFDTSSLIANEVKAIEKLVRVVEYYMEKSTRNNEVYSNHSLNRWHDTKYKDYINSIYEAIDYADEVSGIRLIKPSAIIEDGLLKTVPIIIPKEILSDNQAMGSLTISLIKFIEIDINYILILIKDEEGIIEPGGIKINKNFLDLISKNIDNLDNLNIDSINHPLPIEIDENYLKCFNEKFEIKKVMNKEKIVIYQKLLFELWEYSLYKKFLPLKDDDFKKYLLQKINYSKTLIEATFNSLKKNICSDKINKLDVLVSDIICKDDMFSDMELNLWIQDIIVS